MAEYTVQQLNKSYGVVPILDDVSFHINAGDKIGVIGVNGSGKTTLMRLLVGELAPDSGRISHADDLRIGYLSQHVAIESDESIYDYCKRAYERAFRMEKELRALEEEMGQKSDDPKALAAIMERHARLTDRFVNEGGLSYDSEIRGILKGMGFDLSQLDRPVRVLSGGEKSRLALSVMLCGRPDILFLDEPTNHLDMEVTRFLEGVLTNFRGAVVLITHDRYFLNRIVNRIFLVEHRRLHTYDCGYEEYTKRRAKDLEVARHAYDNQQAEIARQKEIIERLSKLGGSKRKRGIAQSRSRQKLLDKMVLVEKPLEDEAHMKLKLAPKYPSGEDVLHVDGLAKRFGSTPLFQNVSFDLHKGERFGLIGDNGAGKTTLFRILLGEEEADAGFYTFGPAVKHAFFDQEQRLLSPEKTVIDELWDTYPGLDHFQIRSNLARFQFIGDDIFRLIEDLSGGERARVALLELMLSPANTLFLDEPTNHLDIESREILEEALVSYEGTVFVISHDRYFLNRVCTSILHLGLDGVQKTLGNYDDYVAATTLPTVETAEAPKTKTQEKKEKKAQSLAKKEIRKMRLRVAEITRALEALEAEESELLERSYDPALYENYEEAQRIHDMLSVIQQKKEALTDEWLEVETALDAAEEGDAE